jgi:transcriptional regulator with PAS, ATPase and Fis domain
VLSFDEVRELHAVRSLAKIISLRWGLSVKWVPVHEAADGATAPVTFRGEEVGRLVVPGAPSDRFLDLILRVGAEEVASYLDQVHGAEPRVDRMSYDAIIGRSPEMQKLYRVLDRVVHSESTVLIQGENGTGKELIARAVHFGSPRRDRRFVAQNCSAFNDNLLDSELFGHRRGAFTGAFADKQGLFEAADGGTFFLDEVGDMSPTLQVKLLRVLQEGTFIAVGDTSVSTVDVRVIAATNRDLKKMVERSEFREDLYYRINVINLVVPPLRERKEDIPVLVEHFLKKHARGRKEKRRLAKGCLERMLTYPWPGNVRELENELERLVVLAGEEKIIGEELLSPRIRQRSADAARGLPAAVETLERTMIRGALDRHHGNKTRAAHELMISRRNLIRLAQKYGFDG